MFKPSAAREMRSHSSTDQSTPPTIQDGGAQSDRDPYVQGLFNELRNGQVQVRNGLANNSVLGNSLLREVGIQQSDRFLASNVSSVPQPQSWRDPQIYLASAANGKSAPAYYDIADFVSSNVEEEIVVGGNGSHQVILNAGTKKPRLEHITLAQWSVANLTIFV